MKRTLLFILSLMLFAIATSAQSPEAFKYQAVARDAGGQILANQSVSFRISILQGNASGTSVYSETHASNTNTFGLVNLGIGNGVVVSGNFSNIDWGTDSYFVQIEMDETGGNNYQLMGASQLLSVPYAIHAKTTENVDDADADPVNEIELPTGGTDGQVLSTDGSGNYNWTDNGVVSATYSVGDFAHGGVVFWVDETGQHGLVCAIEDQSTGIQWYNGTFLDTKAMREGVYGGAINTERITDEQGRGSYAAFFCAQYDGGDYGDWYLPAKGELNLMYENKDAINTTATANGGSGFAADWYWSSTEVGNFDAWVQYFGGGNQNGTNKVDSNRVRAVRAF